MLVIGLTGQTGAGKTTVSGLFAKAGYRVIVADLVARQAVRAGSPCLKRVAELFGEKILLPDGEMDRTAVGRLVFGNKELMDRYTAICYPYITEMVEGMLAELRAEGTACVLLDAPTLFESGADRLCDAVVSVLAKRDARLLRIMERDSVTEEQAVARINAQPDDLYYISRSRYLIHNDGDFSELETQVNEVLESIREDFTY